MTIALSLLKKEQFAYSRFFCSLLLICSFWKSKWAKILKRATKRVITQWLIWKVRWTIAQPTILKWLIIDFGKNYDHHHQALFENEQLLFFSFLKRAICSFALFCSFSLISFFQKSNWAIALLKNTTKRAIAPSFFWKKQQKEQPLNCSFEKTDKKSDLSITLSKRANGRKWAKTVCISESHFFKSEKRVIAHFQ